MRVLVRIFLLCSFSSPAWSSDFQEGLVAYANGDYVTALREWTPLAEQGHPEAQSALGFMYDTGQGVPENHETALQWHNLAAEQGNANSQYNLGLMSFYGRGSPVKKAAAKKAMGEPVADTIAAESPAVDNPVSDG